MVPHRRGLLIDLLRLTCRLLLVIIIGSLGPVRGSQVVRRSRILRLIGLRCLTLGAIVLRRGFVACCNSKYQSDGYCRQNDTRR